jgi:hypothetical protein
VTAAGKTQDAKLPSNTLRIVGRLTVVSDQTSTMVLDLMLAKSLHLTGSGQYIFAPVLKFQTKANTSVNVDSSERVRASGGRMDDEHAFGMDEKGEMHVDFELPANLKIDASGMIKL